MAIDPTEALEARVAQLEALVEQLTAGAAVPQPPGASNAADAASTPPPTHVGSHAVAAPALVDRRRLLSRGGAAAVGAALGGVAATIATAGPAAAATATFDQVEITGPDSPGLHIHGDGIGSRPSVGALVEAAEVGVFGAGAQWGIHGASDGVGVFGHGGNGLGLLATGARANILLKAPGETYPPMPDPTTGSIAHEAGEIYFADDDSFWLCVGDGTPGDWRCVASPTTSSAFSILSTPVRVYDNRPGSGKPGAGTGPISGTRHGIDLTANSSGLPADATAAMVTMTVTNTQANPAAYGQIYPDALVTPPATSVINWTAANTVIATTTTTGLTNGKVAVTIAPSANVILDLIGYWR